ncbi:hypothetical protein CLAVI_000527 [Candidatus Clavichlamydia salmonicola]|uniref:hypothetical protein n=1 Tax=Candidatus Clavichlamydia salmonicola TaxID=469812 RepID=UPI001890C1D4|nr:hypothetical protein [Candidatus Clavichlamydia salmonicola]MBF5050905.1 hypothetical protein [Candidatus Clavichlamydia salmonicola]
MNSLSLLSFFDRKLPSSFGEFRQNLRNNFSKTHCYHLAQTISTAIMTLGMSSLASEFFSLTPSQNNSENHHSNIAPLIIASSLTIANIGILVSSIKQYLLFYNLPTTRFYYHKLIKTVIISGPLVPTTTLSLITCLSKGVFPFLKPVHFPESNPIVRFEMAYTCSALYMYNCIIFFLYIGTTKITVIRREDMLSLRQLALRTYDPESNLYERIPMQLFSHNSTTFSIENDMQTRRLPPIPDQYSTSLDELYLDSGDSESNIYERIPLQLLSHNPTALSIENDIQSRMLPPIPDQYSTSLDEPSLYEPDPIYAHINLFNLSSLESLTIEFDNLSLETNFMHSEEHLDDAASLANLSQHSLYSWETSMNDDETGSLQEITFIDMEDSDSIISSNSFLGLSERHSSLDAASWHTNSSDDENCFTESNQLAFLATFPSASQNLYMSKEDFY